ncbi:uncharacterized protein MKZ38_010101 [Zalerion maritima]|uniref:Zn(2)-C6 fungal-type domain-containing protein n=1 Tax=Zalerion maritima TaxID=339359 RepID=A0AAD5RG28_9PEZI|nr:uncharacterized protein MKZ38_010101 [Zalerion maritima]
MSPEHSTTRLASTQAAGPDSSVPEPALAPPHGRKRSRPSARGATFYPRKRANAACQVCRARKTKCDNKRPSCSFCLDAGVPCIQSAVDLSSFDPASLRILERLDDLEHLLLVSRRGGQCQEPNPGSRSVADGNDAGVGDRGASGGLPGGSPDVPFQPQPKQPLAQQQEQWQRPPSSLHPESISFILKWPEFQPYSLSDPPNPTATSPSSLSTTTAGNPNSNVLPLDPDPHHIDSLLASFFRNVHIKNPILSESSTRSLVFRSLATESFLLSYTPESCLVLLILALGSLATPFGPSDPQVCPGSQSFLTAGRYYSAAQKRMGGSLLTSDGILGPQCFFLAGVYEMCLLQKTSAWRYFTTALALCQTLEERETNPNEQAVHWSVWKSEREVRAEELHLPDFSFASFGPGESSLRSGGQVQSGGRSVVPSPHPLHSFPSFFPTPPPDGPSLSTDQSAWFFYLAEISLRKLHGGLRDSISRLHTGEFTLEKLVSNVPGYEASANEWAAALPPELSLQNPVAEDDVRRFVLRGHLNNVFELIYWPFVVSVLDSQRQQPHTSPLSPSPRVLGLASKGLETHVRRLTINEPGFRHRHHGTLFMIASCTRSALVLTAARIAGLNIPMPESWDNAVWKALALLEFWERESPGLGRQRKVLQRALTEGASRGTRDCENQGHGFANGGGI